jgi:hypothetical protein
MSQKIGMEGKPREEQGALLVAEKINVKLADPSQRPQLPTKWKHGKAV